MAGLTWREVEEAVAGGADPLAQVLGVGQGGAQAHDSDGRLVLQLAADVAHPGRYHLHTPIHFLTSTTTDIALNFTQYQY